MKDNFFQISQDWWDKIISFANETAETTRIRQTGGIEERTMEKIKKDTKQGKVGEVVTKLFLEKFGVPPIPLDFENYGKGKWDEADMIIGDIKISIKSIKTFSHWLLVNSHDFRIRKDEYDY